MYLYFYIFKWPLSLCRSLLNVSPSLHHLYLAFAMIRHESRLHLPSKIRLCMPHSDLLAIVAIVTSESYRT